MGGETLDKTEGFVFMLKDEEHQILNGPLIDKD